MFFSKKWSIEILENGTGILYKLSFEGFLQSNARNNPADIYLFKVNNKNTGNSCKICSELTVTTTERRH